MFVKLFFTACLSMIALASHATPTIENWQTENGTQVYYVSAHELPMVDIRLIFDAGAARDALPGTALLANAMLNQGTTQSDDNTIAAAFDNVGAVFSSESERDMGIVSLRTLTDKPAFDAAVEMFTEVISLPAFPQASIDRLKNQLKTRLQGEKQSPEALAQRAFFTALYGNHPYANMPNGTESGLDEISRETLVDFYKQYYVANNAVMVIVGALDLAAAKKLSEKVSSSLVAGEKAADLPAVPALTAAETIEIDYPASQTHILLGQPGLSRQDADYFPLFVGNHVLGGSGLVSILSDEIREKRGLSYSAYSYFRPMRQLGPFQMGLQTRNDQAQLALEVMQMTLKNFVDNGPTESQLLSAQQNITGGFALRLDSNSKIADYLGVIGFYNLPLDYLETLRDNVNAVTVEQIKDAYARRIQPDNLVTVLVGGKTE